MKKKRRQAEGYGLMPRDRAPQYLPLSPDDSRWQENPLWIRVKIRWSSFPVVFCFRARLYNNYSVLFSTSLTCSF